MLSSFLEAGSGICDEAGCGNAGNGKAPGTAGAKRIIFPLVSNRLTAAPGCLAAASGSHLNHNRPKRQPILTGASRAPQEAGPPAADRSLALRRIYYA